MRMQVRARFLGEPTVVQLVMAPVTALLDELGPIG